jgi:hypothetical protein
LVAWTGSAQPSVHAEVRGLLMFFCIHGWLWLGLCLHGFDAWVFDVVDMNFGHSFTMASVATTWLVRS